MYIVSCFVKYITLALDSCFLNIYNDISLSPHYEKVWSMYYLGWKELN